MEKLNNKEQVVFRSVLNYLDQNRPFLMDDILPFLNSTLKDSLNVNTMGIKQILNSLMEKNIVIEGSILTKYELLEHEKRRRIYEHVKKHPGIFFNKIVTQLNLSNYVVYWHIKILLKFELIKKSTVENHQIFFLDSVPLKTAERAYYLSKKRIKQIIEFLRNNDFGVSKTQFAKDLNMHLNTVKKYLEILTRYRVISIKNTSKKTLYFLTESYF
ncbi:MAG: HTH domain-containing protein [Candidatus Lokiarchaeota archaeon]|nr:HTH domain-containing protein [Candidatus Lokiarchaeota archaeon]